MPTFFESLVSFVYLFMIMCFSSPHGPRRQDESDSTRSHFPYCKCYDRFRKLLVVEYGAQTRTKKRLAFFCFQYTMTCEHDQSSNC